MPFFNFSKTSCIHSVPTKLISALFEADMRWIMEIKKKTYVPN